MLPVQNGNDGRSTRVPIAICDNRYRIAAGFSHPVGPASKAHLTHQVPGWAGANQLQDNNQSQGSLPSKNTRADRCYHGPGDGH